MCAAPHPRVIPAARALHPALPPPRQALPFPQLRTMNACSPGPWAAPRPRPWPPSVSQLLLSAARQDRSPTPDGTFPMSSPPKTSLLPLSPQALCIHITHSSVLWPPAGDEPESASALPGEPREPQARHQERSSGLCVSVQTHLCGSRRCYKAPVHGPRGTLNLNHTSSLLSN